MLDARASTSWAIRWDPSIFPMAAAGTWGRARPSRACSGSRRRSATCWCRVTKAPGMKYEHGYSGVRLTRRITGLFEEVPAFVGAEQGADVAEGGPERLEGARGRLAQERFDLGERHLDRVQIGLGERHLDRVQIGRVLGEEQE